MKGGVTSGVVFPLALVELAREFRFRNVGGTSAGAIAAALTAAAEYQRVIGQGSMEGFDELAKLPHYFAGSTDGQPNLLNLFPPASSTRRLFAVATAFLGDDSILRKCVRAIGPLLLVSIPISMACFLPMAALLFLLVRGLLSGLVATATGVVGVLLMSVLGLAALAVVTVVRGLVFTLPGNAFGFGTGCMPADRTQPGVTEWLAAELQKAAGRAAVPPLTFGDLWAAGQSFESPAARRAFLEKCAEHNDLRSINLEMMTTALSHGHPYRLPFESRVFAFNEAEFLEYFPESVVQHLIAAARTQAARGEEETNDKLVRDSDAAASARERMYPLPPAWDLPVIVCARLSLSFPILFSMVPLHAVDYSSRGEPRRKCWFIDGGLSSNFPITFFDSPIPRWPTFGIDLTGEHPEHKIDDADPATGVWMVNRNGDGLSDHWLALGSEGLSIGAYVAAILDSIRNWHDNVQMAVPGYRDRIAHVKLRDGEGGLNLSMSHDQVTNLAARGKQAGILLRSRFGNAGASESLNWNNHRWLRYKSAIPLFRDRLRKIREGLDSAEPDSTYATYQELLDRRVNENPKTGGWWKPLDNGRVFREATQLLRNAGEALGDLPEAPFEDETPRPVPELKISPRL